MGFHRRAGEARHSSHAQLPALDRGAHSRDERASSRYARGPHAPHVRARHRGSDCQPYLPRQRWGVRPQLPGAYVTANRDTVRKGRPLEVSLEFTPLSPIDRLVWYSIAWNTNARATTHRLSHREGWPARGVAGIGFRQKHVYADTGQKIIEVVFATTGGERYMRQDTVEVRPR